MNQGPFCFLKIFKCGYNFQNCVLDLCRERPISKNVSGAGLGLKSLTNNCYVVHLSVFLFGDNFEILFPSHWLVLYCRLNFI